MKYGRFFGVTSILPFAAFVPLAWWAYKHPHPPIDIEITHVVQKPQLPFLRSIIIGGNTLIGSAIGLNLAVLPVAFLFWKRRLPLEALMTVGISWTSAVMRTVIKEIVHRPRPQPQYVQVMARSRGKSFPSGHVSSAVDFWGWLLALELLQLKGTPSRNQRLVLSVPVLCILLVGPARVYLGEHWATDVLGGYLFGGGWLGLGLGFYLRMRR